MGTRVVVDGRGLLWRRRGGGGGLLLGATLGGVEQPLCRRLEFGL